MTDKERLASELKEIYWDSDCSNTGFTDMATYVQKAVLEGRINELSNSSADIDTCVKRLIELKEELNELNGKG